MSDLSSAAFAFGVAATFLAATSAHAVDAAATPQAVALVSGGVAAKPADDPSLPKVEMAPAGESRRSDGAEATLDGLARDCANLGAETICKIALVGEGARRKAGAAAAIDAPMTIEVKDGDGRSIETRRISLKVEMPEGVQKVSFRHVEENVSLPPASAAGYGGWTIVVGLEPGDASVADAAGDDGEIEQVAPPPRQVQALALGAGQGGAAGPHRGRAPAAGPARPAAGGGVDEAARRAAHHHHHDQWRAAGARRAGLHRAPRHRAPGRPRPRRAGPPPGPGGSAWAGPAAGRRPAAAGGAHRQPLRRLVGSSATASG
ncbi:hypothetical protein [Chenggangzhangella methanolivorans]|uniref:Uncharacterized protein n=1 Tax=Chenggangzhangella methanolivorans TaxID=1437009 RepID=A0A9E6UNJ2_9HYPH|nr:hypothetical protein [Chenggangzhangella methanolivorans]QZN98594.1 hypothetical protein K6K41_16325 [Chenggangzhangella methanolivorans]